MAKQTRRAARKPTETPAAVWMQTEDLVPWIENPRHQSAAHTAEIVESIRAMTEAAGTGNLEDGFGAPITARLANNEIIAGHTRLQAAHELRMERVPVRFLDIPEEAAHRLARADNRLSEKGRWDLDRLIAQLRVDAAESPEALALQGWSGPELEALIESSKIHIPGGKPTETTFVANANALVELEIPREKLADVIERLRELANEVGAKVTIV